MAIELQRLIKKVSRMDIALIAGENGIHNLVSWVHMVETAVASDFLDGGEIAFTTGIGLNGPDDLLELISLMYNKKVAGVVINIGPFIEKIPQPVINFCNIHDFPLFTIPWKIHLTEVMRIFCFALTKDEQRLVATAVAFKNAMFFPNQEELYVIPLAQQGFQSEWNYCVCIMRLSSDVSDLEDRLERFASTLDTYAQHKYKNFAIFSNDTDLIIITGNYTEKENRTFIQDIYSQATRIISSNEIIIASCGKITKSIRCLHKSYRQASDILKLHRNSKITEPVIYYSDLGIYKLLMGIEDYDIIKEYYSQTLLPLREYDQKNNSDLTEVLKSYLTHNGSVKETADELFVHRNTINYKITKISELLNIDLSKLNSRLILSISFMLEDIL